MTNYFTTPALNQSALKKLDISDRAFLYALQEQGAEPSAAQKLGTATHQIILENLPYVIYPGAVRRGKEWDAFQAEHAGKVILNEKEAELIAVQSAILSDFLAPYKFGAKIEEPHYWQRDGVECKALFDLINHTEKVILDLKTTKSVQHWKFSSDAYKYGYHLQAAWYMQNFPDYKYIIVAVENTLPSDFDVFEFSPELLEMAEQKNDQLFERAKMLIERGIHWREASGSYAGYHKEIEPPTWALTQTEDDE
jgi:hypothetical protein